MKKKVIPTTKYEPIMFLDDGLVMRILNIMFVAKEDERKEHYVGYNEISLMNLMFIFLNEYTGNNIVSDFYAKFRNYEMNYSYDFYIYFIYNYYQIFKDNEKYNFSREFVTNILDLYYLEEVEVAFNPDKFKLHYGTAYTDTLSLKEDVNPSIVKYINKNLPKSLLTDLERAIGIYILLARALRYAPIYTLTEEIYDTNPYFDVTLENNEVVCVQFAIIYHKLLEMYGIESNLDGNLNYHMYVNLNFGSMMIRVDATRYGYYSDQLELSDLTNTKYDFMIEGFYIEDSKYFDPKYIDYGRERLHQVIFNVYKKMGLNTDTKDKFNEFIDKYQRTEFTKNRVVDKSVFDERIAMLNGMFKFHEDNVENTQFFNWMITSVFYDIAELRAENISLYRNTDNGIELSKLLVLYEEDATPYYYLYTDGKLVNYDVDTIVEIILNNGWCFKRQTDIDALRLQDEELILKLCR